MNAVNQRRFSRWLVNCGGLDILGVSRALLRADPERDPLGVVARRYGALRDEQVQEVLSLQESSGLRFGEAAVRAGALDLDGLALLLALQREDPWELRENLVRLELADEAHSQTLLAAFAAEFRIVRDTNFDVTAEPTGIRPVAC
jgi:hypothetical protein